MKMSDTRTVVSHPYRVNLYIAGYPSEVRRSLSRQTFNIGLCVSWWPITFTYTGGIEEGVCCHFTEYPRFPKTKEEILETARLIAMQLLDDLNQWSVLLETPDEHIWITRRPEDQAKEETGKAHGKPGQGGSGILPAPRPRLRFEKGDG